MESFLHLRLGEDWGVYPHSRLDALRFNGPSRYFDLVWTGFGPCSKEALDRCLRALKLSPKTDTVSFCTAPDNDDGTMYASFEMDTDWTIKRTNRHAGSPLFKSTGSAISAATTSVYVTVFLHPFPFTRTVSSRYNGYEVADALQGDPWG